MPKLSERAALGFGFIALMFCILAAQSIYQDWTPTYAGRQKQIRRANDR